MLLATAGITASSKGIGSPATLPIASTGEIAVSGKNAVLDAYLNNATDITGFQMILFTNTSGLDSTSVPAAFTRPSGGAYADVTLTRSSFIISGGVITYPIVTFANTGTDYTLPVTGWALITVEATPRQVCLCISGSSVSVTAAGNPYEVDATITFETGAAGTGITSTAALDIISSRFFKGSHIDLGTDISLTLIDGTNTELTGVGGYLLKTLGTWTVTAGGATHAAQSWTATGADFSPAVSGAGFVSTGTTPTLMHTDHHTSDTTVLDGDTYEYNISTTV